MRFFKNTVLSLALLFGLSTSSFASPVNGTVVAQNKLPGYTVMTYDVVLNAKETTRIEVTASEGSDLSCVLMDAQKVQVASDIDGGSCHIVVKPAKKQEHTLAVQNAGPKPASYTLLMQ